ncbi:hypothetical protein CAPN003_00180 [Capnocytophaga stomatis]|nr:hypothetical protein CAPN003_00180 [Capnocytophaga stomatis]
MMRKRFLCGILITGLLLTSCEKEKDNPEPKKQQQTENSTLNSKAERKIKEVQAFSTKYFYDDETQSEISVKENYETYFTYTNNQITNVAVTKNDEQFYASEISYQGENIFAKITEDEQERNISLSLNEKANVTKREYKEEDSLYVSEFGYNDKEQLISNSPYKYHWDNENMVKVTNGKETINYTYYDTENKNQFLLTFFINDDWALGYLNYFKDLYPFNWGKPSKNLVKSIVKEENNAVKYSKSERDFEYVYDNDYITEIKEKRFLHYYSKQIKESKFTDKDSEKISELWEEVQETMQQIDDFTERGRRYQILTNSSLGNVHQFVVVIRRHERGNINGSDYVPYDEIEKYDFSYTQNEDEKTFTSLTKIHTTSTTNVQKAETTYKIIYE